MLLEKQSNKTGDFSFVCCLSLIQVCVFVVDSFSDFAGYKDTSVDDDKNVKWLI